MYIFALVGVVPAWIEIRVLSKVSGGGKINKHGWMKRLELVLCVAYILYDYVTMGTEAPGAGTVALTVAAWLTEVYLIFLTF